MSQLINPDNIQAFIAYLYKKRNGHAVSSEILQSWARIPGDQIFGHLKKMTQNWGWTEVDLIKEISVFKNGLSQPLPKPVNIAAPKLQTIISNPVHTPGPIAVAEPVYISEKKRSKVWIYVVLGLILIPAIYLFSKNNQFKNLKRLYSITDNVAIRNANGKTIGSMDIFAKSNAITSLRQVDDKIYKIPIEKSNDVSESRKLLTEDATFMDFLLGNEGKIVYVNKSFLTSNENFSTMQRTVFSDLSKYSKEMANVKSDTRKVIIGSLALDEQLKRLFIKNSCANNSGDFTSVLRHQLKDKKTLIVICKMSDNTYYKLRGIPDENMFFPPQILQFKNPAIGNMVNFESQDVLFRFSKGKFRMYTCEKDDSGIYAEIDASGDITYFTYDVDPGELIAPVDSAVTEESRNF